MEETKIKKSKGTEQRIFEMRWNQDFKAFKREKGKETKWRIKRKYDMEFYKAKNEKILFTMVNFIVNFMQSKTFCKLKKTEEKLELST